LSQLPETNRQILEHCYFQGLTLEQIGRKLGLSKSWVCRLHAKSLEMLRKKLVQVTAPAALPHATFTGTIR
jgi:RNA polymerase sigma factor (sigma-70 family)